MSFRIRYSSGNPDLNRPATSFSPRLPFCFGLFHQSRNIRSTTRSANTPPSILNTGLNDSTTASIRQVPLRQPRFQVADTFVPFPGISRGYFPVGGFIAAFARCCFCIAANLLVFTSPMTSAYDCYCINQAVSISFDPFKLFGLLNFESHPICVPFFIHLQKSLRRSTFTIIP